MPERSELEEHGLAGKWAGAKRKGKERKNISLNNCLNKTDVT